MTEEPFKVPFTLEAKRIWVAGHRGMVGSAIVRRLRSEPVGDVIVASSDDVDLRRREETEAFVGDEKPDVAIIAAATVGGIHANRVAQGQFLYDNLMILANCIEACRSRGVAKLVIMGSSCVYPREAPQPMREEYLLQGKPEPTNEGYAVAKIAGLELAKMYRRQYGLDAITLTPTNIFGPRDNFDPTTSHVLPALLTRIDAAKRSRSETVRVWGTGNARREFLYVDDLADATVFALRHYSDEMHLNIGTGTDVSIRELAGAIASVVGWRGDFDFDASMPDGMPRKLLDVSRADGLGWTSAVSLREGLERTYRWYLDHGGQANA